MIKLKFIKFTISIFLTVPLISQELDEEFLNSLPNDVRNDVIKKIELKKDNEKPVYRRASSSIDKTKEEVDKNFERFASGTELFGYNFFDTIQTSFMPINEPNLDPSYILDFGDILEIQFVGQKDLISSYSILRDGSINLPDIGKVNLSGLSLGDASSLIKARVANAFIGTDVYISLKNIRDISILIAGNAFNPGIYTLNGNSNILHALSMAGGINSIGSYRKIDHIRNGKVIGSLDIYDVLVNGNYKVSSGLRSGDSIVVRPIGDVVAVEAGLIRKSAYELKDDETFEDILNYSGGFNKNNDFENIFVKRIINGESEVINLSLEELYDFDFINSDSIFIREFKINTVNIMGAVANPGTYKFSEGATLSKAILTAGGYESSAYPFGGYLENKKALQINIDSREKLYDTFIENLISNSATYSENTDIGLLTQQIKNAKSTGRVIAEFDLDRIANDESLDTLIYDGDRIIIPNITQQVFIQGKVSNPGSIRYSEGEDISYYINKSGGALDSADINNIFIVFPNGETINLNNRSRLSFLTAENDELLIYPGSIIFVPQTTDFASSIQIASIWAPIISSIALSLTSLSVLNNTN